MAAIAAVLAAGGARGESGTPYRPPALLWSSASVAAAVEVTGRDATTLLARVLHVYKGKPARAIRLRRNPPLAWSDARAGRMMVLLEGPGADGLYRLLDSQGDHGFVPCGVAERGGFQSYEACDALFRHVQRLAEARGQAARRSALVAMIASPHGLVRIEASRHVDYVDPDAARPGGLRRHAWLLHALREVMLRRPADGDPTGYPEGLFIELSAGPWKRPDTRDPLYRSFVADTVALLSPRPRGWDGWKLLSMLELVRRSATNPEWDASVYDPAWPTAAATGGVRCYPPDLAEMARTGSGPPAIRDPTERAAALRRLDEEKQAAIERCRAMRTPEAYDRAVARWKEWYHSGAYLKREPPAGPFDPGVRRRGSDGSTVTPNAPGNTSKRRPPPKPATTAPSPIE